MPVSWAASDRWMPWILGPRIALGEGQSPVPCVFPNEPTNHFGFGVYEPHRPVGIRAMAHHGCGTIRRRADLADR